MMLRMRYATPGTEIGYAATRRRKRKSSTGRVGPVILLRAAMRCPLLASTYLSLPDPLFQRAIRGRNGSRGRDGACDSCTAGQLSYLPTHALRDVRY
eukprot:2723274-Rhodomonas_salina.3